MHLNPPREIARESPHSTEAPPNVTLVLGGARSGKSHYAQALAEKIERERPWTRILFLATASRSDEHMRAKIERHRDERPSHWTTVEEPLALAAIIAEQSASHDLILVDCLTLFAANLLARYREDMAGAEAEIARLLHALHSPACSIVLVSNEVGSGVVPSTVIGGTFRDLLGEINQAVAAVATEVAFLVAGLPLTLKSAHGLASTASPQ